MPPRDDDNGFTKGQIALIEQVACRVSEKIGDRLEKSFKEVVRLHQAECPVKVEVNATLNRARGAWMVLTVIAGVVGAVVGVLSRWLTK